MGVSKPRSDSLKNKSNATEIAQIAIAVATIIVGGYGILILSSPFAIPGFKYIMMAPYLSMVLMILMNQVKSNYVILKSNAVFALIMMMVNLYMGLSIILAALLTQLVQKLLLKNTKWTKRIVASAYSSFVLLTALPISKYLIGGAVFENIANTWILISAVIAFIVGYIGALMGEFISRRMAKIR